MLYGAGKLALLSNDLDANTLRGQQLLLPACIASFEMNADTNLAEANCLVDGKKQITAARITQETWTLSLTFEKAGWSELAFAFDELSQTSSNINFPLIKVGIVTPAGTIIDADIAEADDIRAYESSPTPTFLKRVDSAGTPVVGEFTAVDGQLNLPVEKAGAVVSYTVIKRYTTIDTIGEETEYDSFGRLVFNGEVYTTEDSLPMQIVVHQLSRISTPSLSITGDLSELSIEFRAGVPAGKRRPFSLFRKAGAVEA